jgi:hypothetical protein
MNKNLERLKAVDFKPLNPYDVKLLIKLLEDFEDSIGLLRENVRKLHNRIRELEKAKTYFSLTEDELLREKGGGTN